MPIPGDLPSDLRAELEHERARLERSMRITEEAVRPVELDQQAVGRLSRMDSLQNQHLAQNPKEREEARYGAIVAALERMDAGRYGACASCGGPIDPGRLVVFPETPNCTVCG
jgi:DnaK suppressor protein